ncbi:hypothetical protein MBLNU457_g2917t1 [Dothideomycetes sp. NU457]
MADVKDETSTNGATTSPPSQGRPQGDPLPSASDLEALKTLSVIDKDNESHTISDLITSSDRVILVFIRHFFCGNCQQYVTALSSSLPPKHLSSLSVPTKLIIIGCGEPKNIPGYYPETNCAFDIYADRDRKIYDKLGFVCNLTQQDERPQYMQKSAVANFMGSVRQSLAALPGGSTFSGGKISQNGGECVFENGEMVFFHRMRMTDDHLEIDSLKQLLDG